jgi:glycosyltransferase involved in cell wall biosynthesis
MKMKMKIAIFLEQPFDPNAGGVQRSTSKLALIFKSKGHHVIIISSDKNAPKKAFFNEIPIYGISITHEKAIFKKIIEEEHITLLINQAGYSFPLTQFFIKNLTDKTKILNTLRINPLNFVDNHKLFINTFLSRRKLDFLDNSLVRKLILWYHIAKQRYELNYIIKNTDAFIMLSERFKPELYKLAPALKQYDAKIYGIGNPFERPDLDFDTLEKENIILFVGRLNILQKRIDLLLQIWKQIHAKDPNWKFWICGDGPEIKNMKKFCIENKLDRVTFFGKVNPNDYYKKAKIFHMTSAFEGFGNVLIEAQSYGCVPVLFDTYSAAAEIVLHNQNGILVQPLDVNKYVAETLELIENPTKLKEFADNSFENVLRFSYEESYKKWNEIFISL